MGARENPLRQLLNTSVEQAPTTSEEIRQRLDSSTARQCGITPPGQAPSPSVTEAVRRQPPPTETPLLEDDASPSMPSPLSEGLEAEGSPSLGEVAAELAERARLYEEAEASLAAERITVGALDGRLQVVVTGAGTPISLDVSPAALRGHDGRRLGAHIAELILTARQQADIRRAELEAEIISRAAAAPESSR
ncbi:YbaB/EbfC family nucleoid-associated protein [Actinomadura sp. RB99]|uniref:YbaB/EbfC family nucleoid-associated protein n=1 Tax=Actinomadura sp. RB99 TaxID=2691577 RepID=UPI001686C01E|nr:YbaB/EbfC family nucleoid-associated protein [Actinomadura sp. RB99]